MTENNSPLYIALDNFLGLFDIGAEIKHYSYKSKNHFDELWDFESLNPSTMVIVWDDIPAKRTSHSVDTGKYLTPVDWAVGFSLSIHNRIETTSQYPDLKVFIIDVSHGLQSDDSTLNNCLAFIPWVHLIRSGTDGFDNGIISMLFDTNYMSMSDAFKSRSIDMEFVRNLWAAKLTRPSKPGDHHAVSNLVGPHLLIADATIPLSIHRSNNQIRRRLPESADSHLIALRNLMKELGLLPKAQEGDELLSQEKGWTDWNILKLNELLTGPYQNINLIMVDDMWKLGWGRMLCYAVGATYDEKASAQESGFTNIGTGQNGKIAVKATATVDSILEKLEKLIREGKKYNRFELSFGGSNESLEVLFLDLRLFAGMSLECERKFFGRVVKLAENFITEEDQKNMLPWSGFSKDEIGNVKGWIENRDNKAKVEDPVYILALTFLPRLIALTDLSLPIVLFSSTGRHDVTEEFKYYRTIITNFAKPRFTVDVAKDIAKQTKTKFVVSMRSAVRLLFGRKAIQQIKTKAIKPSSIATSGSEKYVEVFIDESGDVFQGQGTAGNQFVIGGLVLVHDNKGQAECLDKAMESTFVTITAEDSTISKKKLVWCGSRDRLPKRLGPPDKEAEILRKEVLPTIHKLITEQTTLAIPIVLRTKTNSDCWKDITNVLYNEHLDNMYLKLFRELMGAVLYDMLPWYLGNKVNVQVKIFAGTRARTKKNKAKYTISEKIALKTDFGIEVINGKKDEYYKSLTPTSFIPIVSEIILGRHVPMTETIKVTGAIGVKLDDDDSKSVEHFRHVHYLADLVAHIDYISILKPDRDVFKSFFKMRMLDEYDAAFRSALDSSKFIEAGENVNALLTADFAIRQYDWDKYPDSIIPKILFKISQFTNTLCGEDFYQFSISLDGWRNKSDYVPPRKAHVQSTKKNKHKAKQSMPFTNNRHNGTDK